MADERKVVAVIPAAGSAARLSPLPCSKELYPIGLHTEGDGVQRPKVVAQYLLEKLKRAGIAKVFISLRRGKADIMNYFGEGKSLGLDIAYLVTEVPYGAPYTIDRAHEFVKDDIVALGFPDILFDADEAFSALLHRLSQTQADVVLGLFPADRPDKCDMVAVDAAGVVEQIVIKQKDCVLTETWGIAVWAPRFSAYLHGYLKTHLSGAATAKELFVGDVIRAAIADGLRVEAIRVSDSPFIDIGTPEDLARAVDRYHPIEHS
jgi:glucose-1-phosphate thymidylyltransferase